MTVTPYATDPYERKAQEMIIEGEGCVDRVYTDSTGHATFGVGHKMVPYDHGVHKTPEQYFHDDFSEAWRMAGLYSTTGENRVVMTAMIFQMGLHGFLGFGKCIKALQNKRWKEAISEMRNSRWCRQTPRRIEMLEQYLKETVMK